MSDSSSTGDNPLLPSLGGDLDPGVPDSDAASLPGEEDGILGFDLLAASLRADAGDLGTFLEVLGHKLTDALPDLVHLDYEQKRFHKSAGGRIKRIEVTLDELRFEIDAGAGKILATITHVVRGMRLKSDEVSVDEWVESLSTKLAEVAKKSAKAREAVGRLLT
jgi:hypothetical protein